MSNDNKMIENEIQFKWPEHQNEFKQRTADIHVAEEFTFNKFMLSSKLLKTLGKLNFVKPSPIQLKVMPLAKCGLDMIIQAKSGTGKTLAFSICLLENYDSELKFPQALVMVPTREIAVQIVGFLNDLGGSFKHFKACEFIGGTDVSDDRKKIQSSKIVVGTPGRIYHLIKNDVFNISSLRSVVLDEADKLLESGKMAKEVMSILKLMNRKIQIIAATATVTNHLEKVMKQLMKNPIGITPKQEVPVLLGIKQFVIVKPKEVDNILLMKSKIDELQNIFTRITFKQCMLFTDSQSKTESYGNYLNKVGWKNEVINGAQDQIQRLDVLDKLINFKCRILITTDLMARGIDIENINLIVNLDLPYDCFTYLHRIGRAGRFGSHGIAITFVNGEEDLEKFQKMLGDIGGDSLKAMKYPDASESYDFWNFQDASHLETVTGLSSNEVNIEEKIAAQKGNSTRNEETVMNNLSLLEITRKLVDDDKSKKREKFDLDDLLKDYEQMEKNEVHNYISPNGCDNIFLKTMEDLQLYESDEKPSTEAIPIDIGEQKHVVFKRIDTNDDEGIEYETESSETEMSEDEIDPERNQKIPTVQSFDTKSNPYSKYVSVNYSQWENIYHYQLANIQNYIQNPKK